jgi:hypothetical protein
MAVDKSELQRLRRLYQEQIGEPMNHFMCPITLRDEVTNDLCEGHILNDAFDVSNETVIQREDIDNYYGQTIEPGAILRIRAEEAPDPVKISKNSKRYVMTSDGEHAFEAAFVNDRTQITNLLKQGRKVIYLTDDTGKPMTSFPPLLILDKDAQFPDDAQFMLRLESRSPIYDGEVEGAMLKSAYLAHFRMRHYRVLKDATLEPVRAALSDFFTSQGDKSDARSIFKDFIGCVSFLPIPADDFPDTLNDNVLLFHYVAAPPYKKQPFAQSCIFRILTNELTIVTLPMTTCEEGMAYYRKLLRREHFDQCVRITQWTSTHFTTNPTAFNWQY